MTKSEVKQALDRIREASAEDIAANWIFIKQVTEAAFGLIKSLEVNQNKRKNKLKAVAEKYGLTQDGVDFALSQYQKVICDITHSRMSKLSYYANDILLLANDLQCEGCETKETLDDPNVFVGEWISVKDRLPQLNQDVLVYAVGKKDGFVGEHDIEICNRYIQRLFPSSPGQEIWSSPRQYFHTDYEITHWMLLPEAPKEDNVK